MTEPKFTSRSEAFSLLGIGLLCIVCVVVPYDLEEITHDADAILALMAGTICIVWGLIVVSATHNS